LLNTPHSKETQQNPTPQPQTQQIPQKPPVQKPPVQKPPLQKAQETTQAQHLQDNSSLQNHQHSKPHSQKPNKPQETTQLNQQISNFPKPTEISLKFLSNWGDKHHIGLTEVITTNFLSM
jgi:hypothetical protein